MDSTIISALSGLGGATIGGVVSYFAMKQTNQYNEKIKEKELKHQEKLKNKELRERIFEECIKDFNELYNLIFQFNIFIDENILQYIKKEEFLKSNDGVRKLNEKFNTLITKKATIIYKLSYIKEKSFKNAINEEFKIVSLYYNNMTSNTNILYEYSKKGHMSYLSDLYKEHEKIIAEIENFKIN